MKPVTPFLRTAAKFILVLALPAIAGDTKPEQTQEIDKNSEDANAKAEETAKLDHDIREVQRRVQMAAPMEVELENGVDPVAEATKNGFIIEVTLEEVEAALAAAAATPDLEDDKRALELRHRGSYRFYPPSATASPGTTNK